jgi:hypothetical protein
MALVKNVSAVREYLVSASGSLELERFVVRILAKKSYRETLL